MSLNLNFQAFFEIQKPFAKTQRVSVLKRSQQGGENHFLRSNLHSESVISNHNLVLMLLEGLIPAWIVWVSIDLTSLGFIPVCCQSKIQLP